MFTGIIEETGRIISVQKGQRSSKLTIGGDVIFGDLKLGDSVAVNGVCLTVSSLGQNTFVADVMSETLSRSALGKLMPGSRVNLERAMPAWGRFGGHIVSGHIDGTGTISSIKDDDNAMWLTIRAPDSILRYVIEKGSICIDGISLTVAAAHKDSFQVSVIPHTARMTTLTDKKVGDSVNLENDMVGKYIEKFILNPEGEARSGSSRDSKRDGISEDFLRNAGF